jgi:hypothetical protein
MACAVRPKNDTWGRKGSRTSGTSSPTRATTHKNYTFSKSETPQHREKRACQHWQVQTWTTAPYTPRENPTKRRNQKLKKALRVRLAGREQNTWDRELPTALFNVRRRRNAATGMSPSQLLYGRDLAYSRAWDAPGTAARRAPGAEREENARRNQQRYVERRQQDQDPVAVTFQPGDQVMLRVPRGTRNQPFGFKWTGPHRVVHRLPGADRRWKIQATRRPPEVGVPVTKRQPPLLERPTIQTISAGVCEQREVHLRILGQLSKHSSEPLIFLFLFCSLSYFFCFF